jgi:hypothetical protein
VMWYLSAAVFCSMGWFEKKLMVVSLVIGFRYISISRCGSSLCVVQESLCFCCILVLI